MEEFMRVLRDRADLPYDAMVPDPALLIPIEEEGDGADDEEAEEIQTDTVHGEDLALR